MASQYHHKQFNSNPAEQRDVSLSDQADDPGIQLQPSAPLYYELDNQVN
jgi:hypothetical protein